MAKFITMKQMRDQNPKYKENKRKVKMLDEATIKQINDHWLDMALSYDLPLPEINRQPADWQLELMVN